MVALTSWPPQSKASILTVLVVALLGGCFRPYQWFPIDRDQVAQTPRAPQRCQPRPLTYDPPRAALLGGEPRRLWRWAEQAFPESFRIGRSGRLALVPGQVPGVALQLRVRRGRVALLVIQSHHEDHHTAPPLSRASLRRFLSEATGCPSYRLCRARVDLDETRWRGHTTCATARVPLQMTTARRSRDVISLALWLPRPHRRHRSQRPVNDR